MTAAGMTSAEKNDPRVIATLLDATHQLARIQPELRNHPFASAVLTAFGLGSLLDPAWPLKVAQISLASERNPETDQTWLEPRRRWFQLKAAIAPIEKLLTPLEIGSEQDFDEVLTIEWRGEAGTKLSPEVILKVLEESNELYRAVAESLGMQNIEPLQLVYASSGSLRFDFKGLGEPIKQMKEVFVEIWRRIRHRKAEDLAENSKAALEGLKVLHAIESLQQSNAITPEEAGRLRYQVVNSTLQIFQRGAVPREIPAVEAVPNQQLIETHAVKLLPAPTLPTVNTAEKKTPTAHPLRKKKTKTTKPKQDSAKPE